MEKDLVVYECTFEAFIQKAVVLIKFPCLYFLEWKTANGKKCVQSKNRPSANNSDIVFRQTLLLQIQLIFDSASKQFIKKETMLNLNLVSKTRQDQIKLVGRVTLDLAEIANKGAYQQLRTHKLSYCSVDGQMLFSAVMKSSRKSNISIQDFDKSSYNEYLSFCSAQNSREKGVAAQEETSIEFAKKTVENAIDMPKAAFKRNEKQFSQTFFVMPSSPRQNATEKKEEVAKTSKDRSLQTATALSIPPRSQEYKRPVVSGKQLTTTFVGSKEGDLKWQQDKTRYRNQIDGNRSKIEQLQKRILQLCTNLQMSKKQVELTERENKQKEEIIKQLKNSEVGGTNWEASYLQVQQKYDRLVKDKKEDEIRFKVAEENLRRELTQLSASNDNLRKETEDLRKIWTEKREHYEQKLRHCDYVIKQKESKMNEIGLKIQDLSKYKYQYQLIQKLNQEKEAKIRLVQKDLMKLSRELQELKKNNLGQENYKLKLQCNQSLKTIEQLNQRYAKCEEEVGRYRQNFIKISTAYEIQSKNYESAKEKSSKMQASFFEVQRESIENKNALFNKRNQYEQLNAKYFQVHSKNNQLILTIQSCKKHIAGLENELAQVKEERVGLRNAVDRLKVQNQVKSSEHQSQMKRIEATFMSSLDIKEKAYLFEKKQLQQQIRKGESVIASKNIEIQGLKQSQQVEKVSFESKIAAKEDQLLKKTIAIQKLNEVIADKQQIIKMCKEESECLKESNQQLLESIAKMKQKQRELNETMIVLEEQSQKILIILQEKENIDKQLEETKAKCADLVEQKEMENKKVCELTQKIGQLQGRCQQLQRFLSQKANQSQRHHRQWQEAILQLEQSKTQFQRFKQDNANWIEEQSRLKQIIKEINERNEEHLRLEEKYLEEVNRLKTEKEQLQAMMTRNVGELTNHNNEIQNRVEILDQEVERMEKAIAHLEEEKRQLQEVLKEERSALVQANIKIQRQDQRANLLNDEIQNVKFIASQKEVRLQELVHEIQNWRLKYRLLEEKAAQNQKGTGKKARELETITEAMHEYERLMDQKSEKMIQDEHVVLDLRGEVADLKEQLGFKQNLKEQAPYNEQIVSYEPMQMHSPSILEEENRISKREQELQDLLIQLDSKNQKLQGKISQLTKEWQQSKKKMEEEWKLKYQIQNDSIVERAKNVELKEQRIKELQEQIVALKKSRLDDSSKLEEYKQIITNLKAEIEALKVQIASKKDEVQFNEPFLSPNSSTIKEEHAPSKREEELQDLLLQLDRKNENLQLRVSQLTLQLQQVSKNKKGEEQSQIIYDTFPEFQRQELNKIIEEQRGEIDRLQGELKTKINDATSELQQRVAELQSRIIELQSISNGEIHKGTDFELNHHQQSQADLAVIAEQTSEDEILYKSDYSLVNSLSKVKSSFEGLQLVELKERINSQQQEKARLQEELGLMEEQKFNLLSTINEKDIIIQDLEQCKNQLLLQISDLNDQNIELLDRIKSLGSDIQSLKQQLTFGSNVFPNEHSVTKSQPFLFGESHVIQNKDIQIQNLKAQIEREKNREEQLMWNIKDLEMQLETVTQNLNALNGSAMNSVLITEKVAIQDDKTEAKLHEKQQGYSKERLLQNLKKNQELKELSHNLIRALKQKENDAKQQEQLFRDLKGNQEMVKSQISGFVSEKIEMLKKKINGLVKEFQLIKIYILKTEGGKLREQVERMQGEVRDKEIMKSVLTIEQTLREIEVISDREESVVR